MAATQAGMMLGTAGYMAPEQAKGKPVDKRADIWAFGVVVHELLTGQRTFSGETIADSLAAVVLKEPQWDTVPSQVQRLLKRCLEKDPQKRLRDIGDAMALVDCIFRMNPANRNCTCRLSVREPRPDPRRFLENGWYRREAWGWRDGGRMARNWCSSGRIGA